MDSAALQYENQKLLQQLEAQKSEMHALEVKFQELKDEQCSYDKTLISLNKMWNQVLSFATEIFFMHLFQSNMFSSSMHIAAD
jgi:predicted nuclease with TOPRIM domain